MIQLNYLRENQDTVIERLKIKNFDARMLVEEIIKKDVLRRETQKHLDDNLAEQNRIAKEIGVFFKEKKIAEAEELKAKTTLLKSEAKALET
ncbi:MAG: serine--tRNA ligase, partial [Bacteroidales bacterium]|nr:serine--tRNA ligase [Bacteroidales bacterium]